MAVPLAGAKILASDLATIFATNTDAWTAYTPTLTQSATVTKTVVRANYFKIGRFVLAQVNLTVTGSGTAANEVRLGLPVSAAATGALPAGLGFIYDSSAGLAYKAMAVIDSVSYVTFIATNTTTAGRLGADTFTAALAVSDSIEVFLAYESAS